ncbi:MAG: dihydroorotate dehydrogenase electron transfer subunit [Asgard group archaeon]|nr:dihydroorotate dehydrogenase electron transfer subunit [Asgard group archaeon]
MNKKKQKHSHKKLGEILVTEIKSIHQETPKACRVPVKVLKITAPKIVEKAIPGQFIMMWVEGRDEKPMGIGNCYKKTNEVEFAVAKVGPGTTAIHELQEGDLLGIRGPYGNGFSIKGKNILIVGGGTGIAPTKFLVETILKEKRKVTLIHGAQTITELAYKDYFEKRAKKNSKFQYLPSTDDGSYGFCGFATECCQSYLMENKKQKIDQIFTCGPELMMVKIWKIAQKEGIPLQASLADRYFKCAIGLCGQCTVDPTGWRLCIDGPVFNEKQLSKIADFGRYKRDKYGRKKSFNKED